MLQLNWNLLFTIINLVVLYFLLRKFLIGPVHNIMDQRKQMIMGDLENAKHIQEEADQLKAKYESAISNAKSESEQILSDAKRSAKAESDRILGEADQKADQMMQKARETIEIERKQTFAAMKSEIAGLAMDVAKKTIGANTEALDNKDIYDQFLDEVGEIDEDGSHE